jgi:hypothetical protein
LPHIRNAAPVVAANSPAAGVHSRSLGNPHRHRTLFARLEDVIHGDREIKRGIVNLYVILQGILESVVYSVIGILAFAMSFLLMRLVAPFSLRKEIEEDQNTALGLVIASVVLGLSIIIAAAIG